MHELTTTARGLGSLLLLLTALVPAWPQTPPPLRSPEVQPDSRVTFRFRAPNAKEVLLARAGAPRLPMQKDEQGVWSITTDPLEPDLYPYTDDPLLESNRKLRAWLTSREVGHTAIETPGAHTWMVWRRKLAAFVPLLFQEKAT